MAVFGTYDQAALDAQYNNQAKVPDVAGIGQRWMARGEEARNALSCDLDLAYGPHDRHRLDVFPAHRPDAPILAFIHGGYWHTRDKTLVHFLAPTFVAADVTLVSVEYRLCPEVKIADIVDDVTAAIGWIHANAERVGGRADKIHVAGHSAGGHLAAILCGPKGRPDLLKGGCSVSGLHDLEPIRLCYLNESLHLTPDDVAPLSPIAIARDLEKGGKRLPPLIATVGLEEGPEYLRQRDELVTALHAAGQPALSVDVKGGNHFTALEAFGDPHHPLCQAMLRQMLSPGF
ncbi:alpha/beta hydrolase [Thalassobaculum salexigens]|uniref:alpha/beta hydrolase n=1 Tax=Thalassobaculum salexigens TaxID=455360 RepID=UPI00248DF69F|nr:alpha/beta hydrolase [Thalassobaculum salexigens]